MQIIAHYLLQQDQVEPFNFLFDERKTKIWPDYSEMIMYTSCTHPLARETINPSLREVAGKSINVQAFPFGFTVRLIKYPIHHCQLDNTRMRMSATPVW